MNENRVANKIITLNTLVRECSNGAVRLVGGQSSNEGRLDYCYNGAWTQLCGIYTTGAITICRQLGYTDPSKNP